jgi:hypothetical protein
MTHHPKRTILPVLLSAAVLISCQDTPQEIDSSSARGLAVGQPIVVSSAAELIAALSPENAGRRIVARAGTYHVDTPLTVPDGVSLEGEGVMLLDAAGLPSGFAPGTRTTLSMTGNVPGDMLTLGDGSAIRGLEIADLPGRVGNVLAVVSRGAGDRVSVTIAETEIVNPNPVGGQTGYALFVVTRNLNLGAPPLPHEGAAITARILRSVVRSPAGGGGLFAFNFAPLASVSVTLTGNVIGGTVNANGGVSLPDAVHDSRTRIESRGNLYRDDTTNPCTASSRGWNLTGGSGPPVPLPASETARNTLRFHSLGDRIEGFANAVLATGARRFFGSPTAGPSTDNSLELTFLGGTISTPSCGGAPFVADLQLAGAFAASDALFPGDGNELRAGLRNVTGSGPRFIQYANSDGPSGPLAPALQGENRLEVAGSLRAFTLTNPGIEPAPASGFFTGGPK